MDEGRDATFAHGEIDAAAGFQRDRRALRQGESLLDADVREDPRGAEALGRLALQCAPRISAHGMRTVNHETPHLLKGVAADTSSASH